MHGWFILACVIVASVLFTWHIRGEQDTPLCTTVAQQTPSGTKLTVSLPLGVCSRAAALDGTVIHTHLLPLVTLMQTKSNTHTCIIERLTSWKLCMTARTCCSTLFYFETSQFTNNAIHSLPS